MKYPDAATRLREKYRRRLQSQGQGDDTVRRLRLQAIRNKLRQGAADLKKGKDK